MGVKPMNCPGTHIQFYNDQRHSYRDLPVRYSEPGLLHRNEAIRRAARPAARAPLHPGRRAHLLHRGAGRGGGRACLRIGFATYELFDFDVSLELSTRPEQRIGTDEMWDRAEAQLQARSTSRASTTS